MNTGLSIACRTILLSTFWGFAAAVGWAQQTFPNATLLYYDKNWALTDQELEARHRDKVSKWGRRGFRVHLADKDRHGVWTTRDRYVVYTVVSDSVLHVEYKTAKHADTRRVRHFRRYADTTYFVRDYNFHGALKWEGYARSLIPLVRDGQVVWHRTGADSTPEFLEAYYVRNEKVYEDHRWRSEAGDLFVSALYLDYDQPPVPPEDFLRRPLPPPAPGQTGAPKRVYLELEISAEGLAEHCTVTGTTDEALRAQIVRRVVVPSARWRPATKGGIPVRATFRLACTLHHKNPISP